MSRACTCSLGRVAAQSCPHLWLAFLRANAQADLLFAGYSYARFLAELRSVLGSLLALDGSLAELIGDPAAWGSHAFRTGAGRDILAQRGIQAAQIAGQWDSLGGLAAYTSEDGVHARCLAEIAIETESEGD